MSSVRSSSSEKGSVGSGSERYEDEEKGFRGAISVVLVVVREVYWRCEGRRAEEEEEHVVKVCGNDDVVLGLLGLGLFASSLIPSLILVLSVLVAWRDEVVAPACCE